MKAIVCSISVIFLFLFVSTPIFAQWQIDQQYGMKINVPSDWSKKSYKDGTDQVYEFYNAEGNAAITLRALAADPSLSMDLLVQVFEQSMLPGGTQRLSIDDHLSYNGIPGKQAVYRVDDNGVLVSIICFYAIQNGNAYIVSGIIPNQLLEEKSEELKQITRSFTINGFERKEESQSAKILPKPPGQGTGAMPQQANAGARPQQNNTGARPQNNNTGARSTANNANPSNQPSSGKYFLKSHEVLDIKTGKIVNLAQATGGDLAAFSRCGGFAELEGKFIITNNSSFNTSLNYNKSALQSTNKFERKEVHKNKVCFVMLEDGSVARFMIKDIKENPSDCSYVAEILVDYPLGSNKQKAENENKGSVAGNYKFVSRSDGKVLTNYHYINITTFGTYEEKYEPKNSPGYEGGNKGTWKVNMGRLYLRHEGGQITDEYMIKGDEIHRTSSSGVTFIFRR